MLNYSRKTPILFGVCLVAHVAFGHGIPIQVDVVGTKLVATTGIVDPWGYANVVYVDGSDDSSFDHVVLPNYGAVGLTNLPGFDIRDVEPESGLSLRVVPRPVSGAGNEVATGVRTLWHWNAIDARVEVSPNRETVTLVSVGGRLELSQTELGATDTLFVAGPLASELNEHVHFLRYLLDNDPEAALGAYGFFAQMSSPALETSEPLLIVINNGLDPTSLSIAAEAINLAARRIGDLNRDDLVDLHDADLLCHAIASETHGPIYDLTRDGTTNLEDMGEFIRRLGTKPGDADLDGQVQFSDFLRLSDHFGQGDATWSWGDFDCDSKVQFSDFLVLAANFGSSPQGSVSRFHSGPISVPEPHADWLVWCGVIFCLNLRGIQRCKSA